MGIWSASWQPTGSVMAANAPVATGTGGVRAAFAPFFALHDASV
jgi:hypothetical protein